MHRKVLALTLIVFSIDAYAQEKIYYDKFFYTISQKTTPYYRSFEDLDSIIRFTEICKDTVTAKGYMKGSNHPSVANSLIQFVKENGNPYKFKDEFKVMRCEIDLYKDGAPIRKMVSHTGKIFYAQIWSKAGEPLLVNGTGKNIHAEKTLTIHEYYTDSVLTEMYKVRIVQQDTLYTTYDKMALPSGGYPSFVNELHKILKYPGLARLANKEGIVYVGFIVDKKGNLTEFTPLTNEGYNLEKKAVDRLGKMPSWEPAIFRGNPVKTEFVIPIRFRLTG